MSEYTYVSASNSLKFLKISFCKKNKENLTINSCMFYEFMVARGSKLNSYSLSKKEKKGTCREGAPDLHRKCLLNVFIPLSPRHRA